MKLQEESAQQALAQTDDVAAGQAIAQRHVEELKQKMSFCPHFFCSQSSRMAVLKPVSLHVGIFNAQVAPKPTQR